MLAVALAWFVLDIRWRARRAAALAALLTQDRPPPPGAAWGPGQRILITFHACGCSVVTDAAGEHLFPCTGHERDLAEFRDELEDTR
jgi:hypothetical protein